MPDEPDHPARLEHIQTQWSLIRQAHAHTLLRANEARRTLVMRYATSIRRYVGAIIRVDEDAADVTQEIVMRMLRGDFGGADPLRGRFRDLLKAVIRNLCNSHFAKNLRKPAAFVDMSGMEDDSASEADVAWVSAWRQTILDLAWAQLEQYQYAHPNSTSYTVLKLRADHPDASMDELGIMLGTIISGSVSGATYRQQLRRSRVRFADYIIDEVTNGLDSPTPHTICEELIALGWYEQVREFLPTNWAS